MTANVMFPFLLCIDSLSYDVNEYIVAHVDVVLHKKSSVGKGLYFVVIMAACIFLFLLFA